MRRETGTDLEEEEAFECSKISGSAEESHENSKVAFQFYWLYAVEV
jgi:hypothetical protein